MKNDPRSNDRNLCNCVKKPEKNSGLQRGLNPWPRDTGATLYQLSYEATDVGSRSILGSYVPVKDMKVNDAYEIHMHHSPIYFFYLCKSVISTILSQKLIRTTDCITCFISFSVVAKLVSFKRTPIWQIDTKSCKSFTIILFCWVLLHQKSL